MSDLSGDALVASILAEGDADAAPTKKEKLLPLIAVVGGLTLVAIAGGVGLGMMLGGSEAPPAAAEAAATPEAVPAAKPDETAPGPLTQIIKLEPIVTNVSTPPKVLVRVEASILIDPTKTSEPDVVAAEIQSDSLTFLRTLDLAQIEGARGLLHLREDLRERAMLRSPAVTDYLIQSLVAQ